MVLLTYLVVIVITGAGLHAASANSWFSTRAQRGLYGGTIGTLSYGIFHDWTLTLDIIDRSMGGELGFFGYFFASGFFAILGVWSYNLIATRRFLVR